MDAQLSRLQAALAGRYAVEQELGRGGMAIVCLGRDERLGRRVAIKVFEQTGSAAAAERFVREVQVASRLQHPNIVPLFEAGEAEGLAYYVMPYVSGASLRERLEREGPLPIADAVRIAREVAEALDHAHRAGIVHRDIKPDNIMLADGIAMVADFGIARALADSGQQVTGTGVAIGTPNYMSPEQGAGTRQVDGRTDIYALGCVLYEMLTGAPPFSGGSPYIVLARHATDAPPPLQTARSVPPALEAVVTRALAKLPADRWPTARAFAEALSAAVPMTTEMRAPARVRWLRWSAVAAAALLLGAAGVWQSARGTAPAADPQQVRSVAVLPFTVRDTGLLDKADGIMETVITRLAALEGLRVPSAIRAYVYRDQQADLRGIGRELGVETILVSSLQQAGDVFRLNCQLVSVSDGMVLWSDLYDGRLLDLFLMQDSITTKIVSALRVTLTPQVRAIVSRGRRTSDEAAYGLYLEARRALNQYTPESVQRAVRLTREALARDSLYADAWGLLGQIMYEAEAYPGFDHVETRQTFKEALDNAIRLDPSNGFARGLRGHHRALTEWDWDNALEDLREGVRLAPGSVETARYYSSILSLTNQHDSALVYCQRALAADPSSAHLWAQYATLLFRAGLADSAWVISDRALALDSWTTNYVRMHVALNRGRRSEADSAVARFLRGAGDQVIALGNAAGYFRRTGETAAASDLLRRMVVLRDRGQWVPSSGIAVAKLASGDRAGALDALELAAREQDEMLPFHLLYHFAPFENEPRFQAVRRQVFGDRPISTNVTP